MAKYVRRTVYLDPHAPEIDVKEGKIVQILGKLPGNVFDCLIEPEE